MEPGGSAFRKGGHGNRERGSASSHAGRAVQIPAALSQTAGKPFQTPAAVLVPAGQAFQPAGKAFQVPGKTVAEPGKAFPVGAALPPRVGLRMSMSGRAGSRGTRGSSATGGTAQRGGPEPPSAAGGAADSGATPRQAGTTLQLPRASPAKAAPLMAVNNPGRAPCALRRRAGREGASCPYGMAVWLASKTALVLPLNVPGTKFDWPGSRVSGVPSQSVSIIIGAAIRLPIVVNCR